jgi:hypothetical protein
MEYVQFLIEFNVMILIPIIIFGLIFHCISKAASSKMIGVGWWFYLLFAWIGTPIHELSHLIMAVIFRYKIDEVKLFRPFKGRKDGTLGYVNYSYNPNNLIQKIGNFFVGIAPMIGGSFAIYVVFRILLNPLYINLKGLQEYTYSSISNVILTTPYDWRILALFLYLVISISIHMSISKADLKCAAYGVVWLEIITLVISCILKITSITLTSQLMVASMLIFIVFGIGLVANIVTFAISKIL